MHTAPLTYSLWLWTYLQGKPTLHQIDARRKSSYVFAAFFRFCLKHFALIQRWLIHSWASPSLLKPKKYELIIKFGNLWKFWYSRFNPESRPLLAMGSRLHLHEPLILKNRLFSTHNFWMFYQYVLLLSATVILDLSIQFIFSKKVKSSPSI